jgi:flavin reductase (DIM6/NTAB) family NADH-FMN oxidoreductase RutF
VSNAGLAHRETTGILNASQQRILILMPHSYDIPPAVLDHPLEVGPEDWQGPAFYQLMTALVVPRPIGWISTISASGVPNIAPYSYFNLMGSDPPYVAFGSTGVKDSLTNLREVPQFVANIVTMDLLERMNFTSGDFPRDEDEFTWAGLTQVAAEKVRPFRVGEAKAHLECEVMQIVTDRNTNIVLGRVVHAHVDPSVWKNGRVDPKLLDPVCRLAGSGYASLGVLVNVVRPQWRNIEGTVGQEAMPRAEQR